jgi:long-chain acyl-CoA synthetase
MKVADLLARAAARFAATPAVVHHESRISFEELYRASGNLAARLRKLDLPAGSRAAILFENSIEYAVAYFAVFDSGLVAVPLDTSLSPESLNFILRDSGASVLIVQGKYRRQLDAILGENPALTLLISDKPLQPSSGTPVELLKNIIAADAAIPDPAERAAQAEAAESPHKLAAVFYTSGSTGSPKGVMLSHRNLVSNTLATVEYLRLQAGESVMTILPFYYIYGNSLLLTHVACGGTVVIDNRFVYPEVVLDEMEKQGVSGLSGVPSTFMILLNNTSFARRSLPALRYFTQAGGAMAPEVTRRLADAFPGKEIWIMYGQTEAAPRVTYCPPEKLFDKLGSIGIPVPGVRVRIVDDRLNELPPGETGEIAVGGPNVMLGYWNQPQDTEEVLRDGWLITGDLARKDDDGYIYVVGRKREIIKASGHRVSAKEIEERILECEKVAEAAVFGVPDEVFGEAIKAAVVLKPGARADAKEIQAWCQKRLAAFKVPKTVDFLESLPKYQSGKVNKLELKNRP